MVETERFIRSYEDPTTNVYFDKDKKERYSKNLRVLKRIVLVVKLCAEQSLPLREHRDNCMNSWKIQKGVITYIAEIVRKYIRYVLDNFFSVIADEVSDHYVKRSYFFVYDA